MANVGTVTFDIAAESAKLRSELAKVQKDVGSLKTTGQTMASGLGSAFAGVQRIVGPAGLALSIAAITTKMVSAASAAIEFADEVGKASAKSGIAAEEFQSLAYAARKVDVDMGALSTSLRVMQTNLSGAASGNKDATATFEALGLTAKDLRTLAPEEQFTRIAEQISRLKDPADRARAATELFGRAGAELLPMFEQGAAGIRSAATEAKQLGLIMTPQQLEQLQRADDAIKELGSAWEGFARSMTSKVAPALTEVLELMRKGTVGTTEIEQLQLQYAELTAKVAKGVQPQPAWNRSIFERVNQANDRAAQAALEDSRKRLGEVERRLAELGVRMSTGGSGPATRGKHDFGSAPPGFKEQPPKGATKASPTASGSDSAIPPPRGAWEGTTIMQGGQLVDVASGPVDSAAFRLLQEEFGKEIELRDRHNEQIIEGVQLREASIMDIFAASAEQQQIIEEAKAQNVGALAEMGAGLAMDAMGRHSKGAKAIGIAQATISTLVAAVNAFKDVPYPLNFAASAMVLASGMKTVSRIKGVDPMTGSGGGGGSLGSPGSLGNSSADRGITAPNTQPQPEIQPRPTVQFLIQGDVYSSRETADWLMDQIKTKLETSDATIIPLGSRQAQELQGAPA